MFTLDERLKNDTFFIKDLKISQLLLMNDRQYFWFILVPKKENLVELIDLSFDEQKIILAEINEVSKILKEEFKVDKINIATLGNVVKQLHIHVIGRFKNDEVFPKPVWGHSIVKPYAVEKVDKIINKVKNLLDEK